MLNRLVLVIALGLSLFASGCDGCGDTRAPADAAVAAKAPVPAPDGLVAKLVIADPGRTIAALRDAAGGGTLLLPRSVGGLVANLFGLPLQAAEHFDDNLAVVGAAVLSDDGAHVAVAFHVRTPSSVIAVSTKGADAKFTSEKEGEAVFLVPTNKSIRKPRVNAVVGVVDNYVVAAESRAGVTALGPYLARTLAREEVGGSDLVLELEDAAMSQAAKALRGALSGVGEQIDLPAHLREVIDIDATLTSLTDTLQKLGGGKVTMKLDDVALTLSADLATGSSAMDAKPSIVPTRFAQLPDDVIAVAGWSESEASRKTQASDRAKGLGATLDKTFGDTWTAEDSQRVTTALTQLAAGRGEGTTMALRCTGMGLTGVAYGDVSDRKVLDEALETLVALRKHEAVKAKLAEAKITVSAKKTRILEVPDEMWRVRLKPKPKDKGEIVEEIDLLAMVRDKRFFGAAGMETVATIQHLDAPDDERSLKSKKPIVNAIERVRRAIGDELWLALMLDLQAANACAVGKPGGAFAAPITLGLGPKGDRVALHLEVARTLLGVLAKQLAGG